MQFQGHSLCSPHCHKVLHPKLLRCMFKLFFQECGCGPIITLLFNSPSNSSNGSRVMAAYYTFLPVKPTRPSYPIRCAFESQYYTIVVLPRHYLTPPLQQCSGDVSSTASPYTLLTAVLPPSYAPLPPTERQCHPSQRGTR